MTVLLIDSPNYGSLDYLIEGLENEGIDYQRIDTCKFPIASNSSLYINKNEVMIKYNNLNLKNINSVFFQGFGSPKVSEIITNETWRSNYRPWQAVYLVGTKDN